LFHDGFTSLLKRLFRLLALWEYRGLSAGIGAVDTLKSEVAEMIRAITLILAAAVAFPAAAPAATCPGPDPAITSVSVKSVATSNALNHYTIVGTVTNVGAQKQASNVIQTIEILDGAQPVDAKGIPPLPVGHSVQFTYVWSRSADAGNGTTVFNFNLKTPDVDCGVANDHYRLTF
jgi:hypothetical protein